MEGHEVSAVSQELEIRPDMIRRWVRQLAKDAEQSFPGQGRQRSRDAELAKLRRELGRVREERDILKNDRVRIDTTCWTRNWSSSRFGPLGGAADCLLVAC